MMFNLPLKTFFIFGAYTQKVLARNDLALLADSSSTASDLSPIEALFQGVRYCDSHNITCPYCHNAFTYAAGSEYEIECNVDRICLGSHSHPGANGTLDGIESPMNISLAACLSVCEAERPNCQGGRYSQDGCQLCYGFNGGVVTKTGHTAFLPATVSILAPIPIATATALPPQPPNITGAPFPMPNATSSLIVYGTLPSIGVPIAPGSGGAICMAADLQCPICDGAVITDAQLMPYVIRCDSYLSSNRSYTFPEPLSSGQCLGYCDGNSTCAGGDLAPNGLCTLVFGSGGDFQFSTRPGYISFFAVNKGLQNVTTTAPYSPIDTAVSYTAPSRPNSTVTMNLTATVHPIPVPYSPTSFSYSPSSTTLPESNCSSSNVVCPDCDGVVVQDSFQQNYRIQCNYQPTCNDLVGYYGNHSVDVCLHHCDMAAGCLAAIYSEGHCDLCEVGMEGAYGQQNGYTVYVALPASATPTSMTVSISIPFIKPSVASSLSTKLRTTITDRMLTTSLMPSSTMVSMSSSSQQDVPVESGTEISDVACPDSDNNVVMDPSDSRRYQVQCDTLFGAGERQRIEAASFEECASNCMRECNGFLFGFGGNCILLTGVSAVASISGWTAGVQVMATPTGPVLSSST